MDFESWVTGDGIRQFSDLCNCCHTQLRNLSHQLISGGVLPATSSVVALSCVTKRRRAETADVSSSKPLAALDQ